MLFKTCDAIAEAETPDQSLVSMLQSMTEYPLSIAARLTADGQYPSGGRKRRGEIPTVSSMIASFFSISDLFTQPWSYIKTQKKKVGYHFLRVEIKMNRWMNCPMRDERKFKSRWTNQTDVHFTRVAEICLSGFFTYRYKSIIKYCIFPLGKVT